MKKFLAFALILGLFGVVACKKKEDQSAQQSQQPAKPGDFQPAQKKKKNGNQKPAATPLKIYQDTQLVKTLQPTEYPTLATTKIKVGKKDVDAITLKELLARNNIKAGKSVTLGGELIKAQLTWQQANSNDIYVYVTPKKFLKLQAGKSLTGVDLPKRLESITVNVTEVAAKAPEKKPANQ